MVVLMKARRSPWIDERANLLLLRLSDYELMLPEDVARQLISDHLDGVAASMRIGRQAARYYVTDEVIQKIADQLVGVAEAAQRGTTVVSLAATRRSRHRS